MTIRLRDDRANDIIDFIFQREEQVKARAEIQKLIAEETDPEKRAELEQNYQDKAWLDQSVLQYLENSTRKEFLAKIAPIATKAPHSLMFLAAKKVNRFKIPLLKVPEEVAEWVQQVAATVEQRTQILLKGLQFGNTMLQSLSSVSINAAMILGADVDVVLSHETDCKKTPLCQAIENMNTIFDRYNKSLFAPQQLLQSDAAYGHLRTDPNYLNARSSFYIMKNFVNISMRRKVHIDYYTFEAMYRYHRMVLDAQLISSEQNKLFFEELLKQIDVDEIFQGVFEEDFHNLQLLTLLIKKGAAINSLDEDGRTVLHKMFLYTQKRNTDPIKMRVKDAYKLLTLLGNNGIHWNIQDKEGKTALHYLVENPNKQEFIVNVLKELVQHGADLNIRDNEGRNVFHCLFNQSKELNKFLTQNLIQCFIQFIESGKLDPLALGNNGKTYIHELLATYIYPKPNCVSEDEIIELIKLLKEKYSVDVNVTDNKGKTILYYANKIMLKKLAQANLVDPNLINALDAEGKTLLLHEAINLNRSWLLNICIDYFKADTNAKDVFGRTCLHHVVKMQPSEEQHYDKMTLEEIFLIAEKLIANGADIRAEENAYNMTPVDMAVFNGQKDLALCILKKYKKVHECEAGFEDYHSKNPQIEAQLQKWLAE